MMRKVRWLAVFRSGLLTQAVQIALVFLMPVLANADVEPNTAALLDYLKSLGGRPDNRCLVGQYIQGFKTPSSIQQGMNKNVEQMYSQTGHKPAIIETYLFDEFNGSFISDTSGVINKLASLWEEGYILYLSTKNPNPETLGGGHVERSGEPAPADMASVYTPGTKQNKNYKKILDQSAIILGGLKQRGIPVIFEPFNELNGFWMWNYPSDPNKFAKLWRYTHDYLTQTKGLNNLLWSFELSCGPKSDAGKHLDRYPGDDYVDIMGMSIYHNEPGGGTFSDSYKSMINTGKVVAFTEFGPQVKYAPETRKPNPPYFTWDNMKMLNALKNDYPDIRFFIRWSDVWAPQNQNNAKECLSDSWLVDFVEFNADPDNPF